MVRPFTSTAGLVSEVGRCAFPEQGVNSGCSKLSVPRRSLVDGHLLRVHHLDLASDHGVRGRLPSSRHRRWDEGGLDHLRHPRAVPRRPHLPDCGAQWHGRPQRGADAADQGTAGRLHQVGRRQLARRPDRAGQVAARQRRDQPGRVRRASRPRRSASTRSRSRRGCGGSATATTPELRCSRHGRNDRDRIRRL